MAEFLHEQQAVVEVWTCASGGRPARRLRAGELSERAFQINQAPALVAVTYLDPETGMIERGRLDFGTFAAELVAREADRYRLHRLRRDEIRRALRAKNGAGDLSACAQWEALRAAAGRGTLEITEMPSKPSDDDDFFVACECEVGGFGQITRVVRVYRGSQVSHRIVGGTGGLFLRGGGGKGGRVAVAVRQGEGAGVPVPGRDVIEIRVPDARQTDPRYWNLLEFGEAWVLRESGLAQMGLVNAHLENRRKQMAWRKSNYDRFAEPLFAGLNVGGGIAGAGAPLGEAARLAYNVLVTGALTPDVPSNRELEDLLRFVAARSIHPRLARKPGKTLTREETEELWRIGARLSAREVEDALRAIGDDDVTAMLSFPRWQNMDQKYRLVVDILTDLFKVTGKSEAGILEDVFNNSVLSPNGEFSITTALALALGNKTVTPLSGVSLEQLARGDGPVEAWLQYLNFTVDLRAVANTLSLWRLRTRADRELRKPFGHAPRLNDLAAYEFRIFGYPTLFWYKRGLLKNDLEAFSKDFAYGVLGTEVVERFPTQNDFLMELSAGRLAPIGFAWIPEGLRRAGRESNLPVFAHRIRSGKHAGQTAIIVYGLKAYRQHSAFMERELRRFRQYERMLVEGGVITRLLEAENPGDLQPLDYEPRLEVGSDAVSRSFKPLLGDLLEFQRILRFTRWSVELEGSDLVERERLESRLRHWGVAVGPGSPDPLGKVDPHFSSFIYRATVDGSWRRILVVHVPGVRDLAHCMAVAEEGRRREAWRRRAAGRMPIGP
jgi:hypothetical protein